MGQNDGSGQAYVKKAIFMKGSKILTPQTSLYVIEKEEI
jgi:hypothetical protein